MDSPEKNVIQFLTPEIKLPNSFALSEILPQSLLLQLNSTGILIKVNQLKNELGMSPDPNKHHIKPGIWIIKAGDQYKAYISSVWYTERDEINSGSKSIINIVNLTPEQAKETQYKLKLFEEKNKTNSNS